MHVPEPALEGAKLCRGRRCESVRMDAGQGEMPEGEPHVPVELLSDLLDRMERLPRVLALVVAILDDQGPGTRTTDVIDFLIQRLRAQLAVVRHRVGVTGRLQVLTVGGLRADIFQRRDAGQHRLARGIEITDDLDAEPVLFECDYGGAERRFIRQRGEPVGVDSRAAHCCTSSMQIALPETHAPGS